MSNNNSLNVDHSQKQQTECNEAEEVRINDLPHDTIDLIFCYLNVKDILRRWMHLLSTNLDFDASNTLVLQREEESVSFRDENASRYVNWVNLILVLNDAPIINKFRVCFPLRKNYFVHIDRWVEFAASKHVKILELDFSNKHNNINGITSDNFYELRYDLLKRFLDDTGCLSLLTSLCLKCVNIDGELLDSILSRCHSLERLVVENSHHLLKRLKVTNSSPSRLKHLTVNSCTSIKELEIDIAAAVFFKLTSDSKCGYWMYDNDTVAKFKKAKGVTCLEVDFAGNDDNMMKGSPSPTSPSSISFLKSIHSLTTVFLPFLEQLILYGVKNLANLKITSSLCRLKHVIIADCYKFEKLEIDLLNVVSLEVDCFWKTNSVMLLNNNNSPLLQFRFSGKESCSFYSILRVDIDYYQQGSDHPSIVRCDDDKSQSKGLELIDHSNSGTNFLKSLNLTGANVGKEVLEDVLSRFPYLERLIVRKSKKLVSLKVTESSKSLQHLEIQRCNYMKKLELHAPNLTTLEFYSKNENTKVIFGNVPSLVDVSAIGEFTHRLQSRFKQNRNISAQLTKLTLSVDMVHKDLSIPAFDNVRDLVLMVNVEDHRSLLPIGRFAEACPLLREFKLEMCWDYCYCNGDVDTYSENETDSDNEQDSEVEDYAAEDVQHWLETDEKDGISSSTLTQLKKFEVVGVFKYGVHVEYEYMLILYIIKNAIQLEKFICTINRSSKLMFHNIHPDFVNETQLDAAQQLAKVIPSRIDVEIICVNHVNFSWDFDKR